MQAAKVLVLHNRYRQRGGEDEVFDSEVQLLRKNGHTVVEYVETNERFDQTSIWKSGLQAIWSVETMHRLRQLLEQERPDVAHFHNTFARISPAAYYACSEAGVPVVQTLHNFRIGCLNACCATDQGPCERCVPNLIPLAGILKGCYRGSRSASAAMAAITSAHKILGTYRNQVDAFIALTEFAKRIQVRSGVPEDKIFVKPNFAEAPPEGAARQRRFALFVGRLCPEKGVSVLLEAWERAGCQIPLRIVGDGPSAPEVAAACERIPGIEWLGARPHSEVMEMMRGAQFLVMPSLLYENFGLCLVEAFSAGVPCIASGHGSMQEIVQHERTGLHFEPGNSQDLAAKILWMVENKDRREQMGREAAACFRSRYTPEHNYQILMKVYESAINRRRYSLKSATPIILSTDAVSTPNNSTPNHVNWH